ncbi:MAG: hypothetical protein H0U97_10240 [Gammaproteobacteria bacterium]|nr:hypothetical protein [Gammaproteobacteria bacterium]
MFTDWNSADWTSITIGFVLFAVGWWIGRRQGQIIERVGELTESQAQVLRQVGTLTGEIHDLQSAVAELQVREKVGVIKERAFQVQSGNEAAVFTLLEDTRSVLPLYEYTQSHLRAVYEDALSTALETLYRRTDTNGKALQHELATTLASHISHLAGKGRPELAAALRLIVAKCAGRVYRLGDIESAKKVCALVFPPSAVDSLLRTSETELAEKLKALGSELACEQVIPNTMPETPPDLFASFFRPAIRVCFNWDRLLEERWPIKVIVVDERQRLADFYPPWYLSPAGEEVGYLDIDARPFPLSAIPDSMKGLRRKRQDSIKRFSTIFTESRQPIHLVLPAYALTENRYLLLDGTHRAAALLLSDVVFRMMVFVVNGPLDAGAVADLVHWARPRRIAERSDAPEPAGSDWPVQAQ